MDDKMHSKRLGLATRAGLALTGANPERARWAGHDDQSRLVEVGVSLVLCLPGSGGTCRMRPRSPPGSHSLHPWSG